MLNDWIEKNYNELLKICRRITGDSNVDDILHSSIEQLLKNKRVPDIPDSQKLFFFVSIVKNNYNSTTSPYHRTYRKFKFQEMTGIEIEEIPYTESEIDLDWVKGELKTFEYYYMRLFELYIEEGCSITKLSQRTTIPINSVSRDINKVRKELNKRRNKMM